MTNPTYEKILNILKQSLFDTPCSIDASREEWLCIYRELELQAVASLPYDVIEANPTVPVELKKKWTGKVMFASSFYFQLLFGQAELIELLLQNNIPVVILKGISVASYYPVPYYRAMGDIDFLVPNEKYEEAIQILQKNGYALREEENMELDHVKHSEFSKNHITYELHGRAFRVKNHAGSKVEQYLFSVMDEGFKHPDYIEEEEKRIPVLPCVQFVLELLLHMESHLTEGFGLRHIIDWMMFTYHELSDETFEREVRPVLDKAGLTVFAGIVTKTARMYLGLPDETPNGESISWYKDADTRTCERLMEYIIEQGNFGRKVKRDSEEGSRIRSARVVSKMSNPITFFKFLQEYGLRNWELARRNKFVGHFAWLYQLTKYVGILLSGKQKLGADLAAGKERKKMMEGLQLFR